MGNYNNIYYNISMSNNNDPPPVSVNAPSGKPSDNWPGYTDSAFSNKHLNRKNNKLRTSPWVITIANLIKLYVGVASISTAKAI